MTWQVVLPAASYAVSGDANCDGVVDPSDATVAMLSLFGGDLPVCPGVDANQDEVLTAADLVAIVAIQSVLPPEPRPGPRITFLGLAGADGSMIPSAGTTFDGLPIYQRNGGAGFFVVVEAAPGASEVPAGGDVGSDYPEAVSTLPDLQIEVSRPLGSGLLGGCVDGGVPGVDPPRFDDSLEIVRAVKSLSCGFSVNDTRGKACTINEFAAPTFVSGDAQLMQFCRAMTGNKAFPQGETIVTAQLRDRAGNLGPTSRMVVLIGNPPTPTSTATRTRTRPPLPTATPSPSPTRTPTSSPTPNDTRTPRPTSTPTHGFTPGSGDSPSPTRPTLTPTQTPRLSFTRTQTPSATVPTGTPTRTHTGPQPTSTQTPLFAFTRTSTPTRSASATRTQTRTRTPTRTRTGTVAAITTGSPSPTATLTRTTTAPPTASPSRTPTRTATGLVATPTRTPTRTPTSGAQSPTRTRTTTPSVPPGVTHTLTRTPTRTLQPTLTATRTPTGAATTTRTPTRTTTATRTASLSLTATRSSVPTLTRTVTRTWTVTATRTPTRSASMTPSATRTPTTTRTFTVSPTRTVTLSPQPTSSPTRSPTPRPTLPPVISYIGVARGDVTIVEPIGQMGGINIFARNATNFSIVIEAESGTAAVGTCTYAAGSECSFGQGVNDGLPDLQVLVSQPLGNGSPEVCDNAPPSFGGVPATSPPSFTLNPNTIAALNDLGCRFRDGLGRPRGRGIFDACTAFDDGTFHYVSAASNVQFCAHVTSPLQLRSGDTLITARVRDVNGVYSAPKQIIIRVP